MDAGFGQYRDRFRHQTFLTCLSEHGVPNDDHGKGDLDEDRYGRLSMWRAYGSPTGVAIVLNGEPFLTSQLAGGPIWTPVAYLDEISFPQKVDEVTNSIETHMPFLRSIERGTISLTVFNMLRWAVLATKHPGFFEEREWRAVFSPNHENASGLLHSIETIRGVPQPVWKIRLDSMPGFDLPALIERIIIGPTQDPIPIYEALVHTLREAGVSEPENKVTRSNIPLRR